MKNSSFRFFLVVLAVNGATVILHPAVWEIGQMENLFK